MVIFWLLAPGEVIYFLSGLDEEITSKSALERAYQSLCFSDYTDKSALGKYFVQKISRLRKELDQGYIPNDQSYVLDDSDVINDSTIPPTRIEAFELLAEDEVRVLIANSRSTSCCLDPIPTHLLKSCSESLISVITNIINSSLELGIFPDCWKEAVVIPLLKKPGLESLFKNLRPVSNLAYFPSSLSAQYLTRYMTTLSGPVSIRNYNLHIADITARRQRWSKLLMIFY